MRGYQQRKRYFVRAVPPFDQCERQTWSAQLKAMLGDRYSTGVSDVDGWPWQRIAGGPNYGRPKSDHWTVLHSSGRVELLSDAEFRARFRKAQGGDS